MSIFQVRWAYVLLAFIQAALTSGVIFGWVELETIFIRNGVYRDHCSAEERDKPPPCDAQKIFFSLIYTVGVFSNNAAPLLTGVFLDKFGPKLTSLASVTLFICGCALFIIPNPKVYAPAFGLLGFSGPGVYVAIMHINNLFPGHQASVLSFFSGTFTVSNFVFKIFRILNGDKEWFTLPHLFLSYIVLLIPFFLIGTIFWPNKPFQLPPPAPSDEKSPLLVNEKSEQKEKEKAYVDQPLYGADLKAQITAPELWLMVVWMAVTNLHVAFYLGTVANRYPKDYVAVFNWIWELGFVAIPLYAFLLDNFGITFSIFFSNVGMTIFSIIAQTNYLNVQYVGFVLVSGVNVGVWGIFYTFLSKTFGFNNYGKLLGVACATIAVVGGSQFLLALITVNWFSNSYLYTNILFTILTLAIFYTPYYLWKREREAAQRKREYLANPVIYISG